MKIKCFKNKEWRYSSLKALWVAKLFLFYLISIPIYASSAESLTELKANTPIQMSVSGTVSDDSGPLPGVNIIVKGTSQGTQTDFDGNFSINVDQGATLVFSYLGYKTKEVVVDSETINVSLEADVAGLDEVVVVGYGTRTRGELTGAVSTLKSEDIERTSSGNLSKSLAGKIPGLTVSDRGGYPGENAVQVFVRGRATLGNNEPLYVIDGVPSTLQAFSFLAPGDISNMSVLKDAAAAIYGARAANGVILVTTKRGKSGKAKISLSTTQQIQQFTRTPRFMNSFQFTTYKNEYDTRHGNPLEFTAEDIENFRTADDPILYPDTNWFDLTMRDWAHQQRHSVSISGGSDNIKYFVNGDMLDQGGQYKSGDLSFKQYQIRSNLDIKINDRVKLGVDLYGLSGKRVQPGVSRGFIYKHLTVTLPTEVGQYPNGLYGVAAEDGANPAIMSSFAGGFNDQRNTELRTRFNLDIDLGFITEGLALNANTTLTRRTTNGKHLTKPWTNYAYNPITDEYVPQVGFDFNSGNTIAVRDSFSKFNEEYINAQIKYNRTFGDHTFRGFVALEQTKWRGTQFEAYKRDLPSDLLPDLFAGGDEGRTATGVTNPGRARQNYFGSLSYNYKKKYLIDFTLRYDGSDIFPEGQKYGTFPGVQVGWVISKEPFMESTSNWLNNLKLRASWAQIGNDRIQAFAYLDRFILGGSALLPNGNQDFRNRNYYIFGESPALANSFYLNSIGNPNVTWESATSQNIGLSFAMFDNKLNGDFNYYWGDRSDILTSSAADIPSHAGLDLNSLPNENIGIVDNWGWEFELSYADQINDDFSYTIGGNIANAQNEIVYMAEAAGVPEWRKQEGHSLGSFLAYPTDGLYKTQAEIDADPAAEDGTLPGDIKYIDTDGNGEITGNDVVRRYTSNVPEITYSFNTGIKYKNFDLNLLFQGQANANISIFFDNSGNRPAYLFEQRWTPENPNARYPRAYERADVFNARSSADTNITADTWIHDASFLRLRELQVGYNIPKSKTKFADVRVFVRGSNVFTWDKLKDLDLDPEMPSYLNFEQGLYQPLKTWSLGLNINL